MAREESLQQITLPSHADYTASQYCFVSVNSSGRAQVTGDGAQSDGVLQDKPTAQDIPCAVAISGVSKVLCGGSVTKGGLVASDSAGKAVNAGTGDVAVGVALETGETGYIISVLLKTQNCNVI